MLLFKAWTYDLLLGFLTKSIIRFLKNFFAWFRENKWKNPGNICLFVFRYVVGNTLVWCIPIKLCRYIFPEGFVILVCFELVLARFLNSWKKVSCHKAKLGSLRNVFSCLVFYLCCLRKAAILRREYVMFLASLFKYLFISKWEIGQKLPTHSCGFAGWLLVYGITNGSKPWDVHVVIRREYGQTLGRVRVRTVVNY